MESASSRLWIPGLVGLVVGVGLSVVTGLGGSPEKEPPPIVLPSGPVGNEDLPPPPPKDSQQTSPRVERQVAKAPPPPDPVEGEGPASVDEDLPSQRLLDFARAEIIRGWADLREDEIPDEVLDREVLFFRQTVLELPGAFGQRTARTQIKADALVADAESGGLFTLLEQMSETGTPVLGLVRDRKRFERFFEREVPAFSKDRSLLEGSLRDKVEKGMTVLFGAGVHVVRDLMPARSALPRDVTLQGGGMDVSMLKLSNLGSPYEVQNLTVRDCTVHVEGWGQGTEKGVSLRFERVRFVGFDSGAGGSSLINSEESALHFIECRIEGGYGASPRSGSLFDIRTSGLIARFDGCSFSRLNLELAGLYEGATVVFSNCDMLELFLDPLEQAQRKQGVVFEDCRIQVGAPPVVERDLNDLFPGWLEAR